MTNPENPALATLIVLAYNQERYIREAIKAAFAQTYSPLEILLSDDCSADQTFSIMRQMAARYSGPHEVRLNRNEQNVGIGEHINKAVDLSRGKFLVVSAGDDVSLPQRTESLVDHFVSHPDCNSVFSNMKVIDMDGEASNPWRPQGWTPAELSLLQRCRTGIEVFGCTHAWRKAIFDVYGQLDPQVIHEDIAIPFRSSLAGSVDYVDQVLVHYRRHDANVWTSGKELDSTDALLKKQKRHAVGAVAVRQTMLNDFLRHLELTGQNQTQFKEEISALKKGLLIAELERDLLNCSSGLAKGRLVISAAFRGAGIKPVARLALLGFAPGVLLARRQKQAASG